MPRLRWRMYLRQQTKSSSFYTSYNVPVQCPPSPRICFPIPQLIIHPTPPPPLLKNKALHPSKFARKTSSTSTQFQSIKESRRDDIRLRNRRRISSSSIIPSRKSSFSTDKIPSCITTEAQRSSPQGRSRRPRPRCKVSGRLTCGHHVAITRVAITETHQRPVQQSKTDQLSIPHHDKKIYHQTKAGRL